MSFSPVYSLEENFRNDQDCLAEEGTPENENAHFCEKKIEKTETIPGCNDERVWEYAERCTQAPALTPVVAEAPLFHFSLFFEAT